MSLLESADISSNLLRPNVQGQSVDLPFRRTPFLDLLRSKGAITSAVGGSPFKWNVISAANSSAAVFVEGQPFSVAGKQTYKQASLAAFYTQVVVEISGHVRDNIAKGGTYEDVLALELVKGEQDLYRKVEDELLGSTADRGIASIIDAGDTYATLAPGSVTAWASEENAIGGALTVAVLADLYEELTSSSVSSVPRGAMPDVILLPPNQSSNYGATIGMAATSGGVSRYGIGTGAAFDLGHLQSPNSYNGIPMVIMPGMTTTELYMLDMSSGVELLVHRDVKVDPLAKTADSDAFAITMACALKVHARNKHGKLTGVTA